MSNRSVGKMSGKVWFRREIADLKRRQKIDPQEFRARVLVVYQALQTIVSPGMKINLSKGGDEVLDTKIRTLVQSVSPVDTKDGK